MFGPRDDDDERGREDEDDNQDEDQEKDQEKDNDPDKDIDYFVSADGRVCATRAEAISESLGYEDSSGTGAGCGQDPANVDSGKGSDK